jgi:hypothetical protein
MRRPLPQRARNGGVARAQSAYKATRHRTREILEDEGEARQIVVSSPPGPASIGVTHGAKFWTSDSNSGITVESTCAVTLSCDQTLEALTQANEEASSIADKFVEDNMQRMKKHVAKYLED